MFSFSRKTIIMANFGYFELNIHVRSYLLVEFFWAFSTKLIINIIMAIRTQQSPALCTDCTPHTHTHVQIAPFLSRPP